MDIDALVKTNPIVLLAIAIIGITVIIWRLVPSINSLVSAALSRRGWIRSKTTETEVDPLQVFFEQQQEFLRQQTESVKSLVITMQLMVETMNQRDARIGNLADTVKQSADTTARSVEVLTRLAESISQLALTENNQSSQIATQTVEFAKLGGRLGETRQQTEEVQKAVEDNSKRISELREQVEKLEKDLREQFLPTLQQIRETVDTMAQTDLSSISQISAKVNYIEAELKAFILKAALPAEPKPDAPAPAPPTAVVETKPEAKAVEPPKEDKPNDKPTT